MIIAAAGGAAHLPGVVAAHTLLPVLGVPMTSPLSGLDSLLSMVQMPAGMPVATFGIGEAGADQRRAVRRCAAGRCTIPGSTEKLQAYRAEQRERVLDKSRKLKEQTGKGMKFVVDYFGCRSNQAEVQEWIIELEKRGYELTTSAGRGRFRHPQHLQRHRQGRKGRAALHRPHLPPHRRQVAHRRLHRQPATSAGLEPEIPRTIFFLTTTRKSAWSEAVCELFPARQPPDLPFILQIAGLSEGPGRLQFPLLVLHRSLAARQGAQPAEKGSPGQGRATTPRWATTRWC